MLESILRRLGLGSKRRETVTTVKLEVIAQEVREFNEARKQLNEKIVRLETKTSELDDAVARTLDITRENKKRLDSIEASLEKIISMSESLVRDRVPHDEKPDAGEPEKTPSR